MGASGLRSSWARIARNSSLRMSASRRSRSLCSMPGELRSGLILPLPRSKGRANRAHERRHAYRPLQHRDVAELIHRLGHRRGVGAGPGQDEHRQVGPLRLPDSASSPGGCCDRAQPPPRAAARPRHPLPACRRPRPDPRSEYMRHRPVARTDCGQDRVPLPWARERGAACSRLAMPAAVTSSCPRAGDAESAR